MWNEPSKEQLDRIPNFDPMNEVDVKKPYEEYNVYLHFYINGADWYVTHYDGNDIFSGFCKIDNSMEWGSFSYNGLKNLKLMGWAEVKAENSEDFPIQKASAIPEICEGMGLSAPI